MFAGKKEETVNTVQDNKMETAEKEESVKKPKAARNSLPGDRTKYKRYRAYGEFGAAILLLLLSVCLFRDTLGTRLLYVDVIWGRICRYYWIGILFAAVLGIAGAVTLKKTHGKTGETEQSEDVRSFVSKNRSSIPIYRLFVKKNSDKEY